MKPYSMEVRLRVLADCDSGLRTTLAAERHKVSPTWIRKLLQQREETGAIAPRQQQQHGPRPKLEGHEEEVIALTREFPDASLEALCWELTQRLWPIYVSRHTLRRTLERMGLREASTASSG